MPKRVEAALRKAGEKKGYTGERLEHFIYGIMADQAKKKKVKR